MSAREWPWPADTSLDIARRLLQSYRDVLQRMNPEVCEQLDAQAVQFGQEWVVPRSEPVDPDDLMPAADIAALFGIDVDVIHKWAHRGHIEKRANAEGARVFRVGDVLDYQARTRRERLARAGRSRSGTSVAE